ncbi:TPA: hypothetical protein ACXM9H_001021, partial [Burkholderia multivorans]
MRIHCAGQRVRFVPRKSVDVETLGLRSFVIVANKREARWHMCGVNRPPRQICLPSESDALSITSLAISQPVG